MIHLMMFVLLIALAEFLQGVKDAPPSKQLFADKNLEAAVREGLFSKRGSNKPITAEDLRSVTQIHGKEKGIRDLRGLERCTALATLDLTGNNIIDLAPLGGLKNLQGLFLAKNQISDLKPLAGLVELQYLDLDDNQIVDLTPISGLSKLTTLCLSNNKISDPNALSGLVRLWTLRLSGNRIDTLSSLKELTQLCVLSLKGNRIVELSPIAGLKDLRFLFLENNHIQDLTVLIDMAKKDAKVEQRFAPFWNIYLSGNPLSDAAQTTQVVELRNSGATVILGEKAKP
jgi:internalin A